MCISNFFIIIREFYGLIINQNEFPSSWDIFSRRFIYFRGNSTNSFWICEREWWPCRNSSGYEVYPRVTFHGSKKGASCLFRKGKKSSLPKSYMGSSWNFYHGKWKAKLSSTTWNGGWRVRSKHMNVKASRLKKERIKLNVCNYV